MSEYTRVSAADIRLIFNTHVLPRVGVDLLEQDLRAAPAPPAAGQPPGTESVIVQYVGVRDGELEIVAKAHYYRRPDGSVGASGKPDPKRVLHDGVFYVNAPDLD